MASDEELVTRARRVWTTPTRRVHLDWYDGPVQSVLYREDDGAWYVFAVAFGPTRERLYALRPLVDASVLDRLADVETVDDPDWLENLGREELLPACRAEGVLLVQRDESVLDARQMDEGELAVTVPRGLHALMADGAWPGV